MEQEWKKVKERLEKEINKLKDEITKLRTLVKEFEVRNELVIFFFLFLNNYYFFKISEQKLELEKKLKLCENSKQALQDEKVLFFNKNNKLILKNKYM